MLVAGYGAIITVSVLSAVALAYMWLGMSEHRAVTVSFLTLAFAQLAHVFNMHGRNAGIVRNDVTRNAFIWGALALCTALLLMVVYLPPLADVLRLEPPGSEGWGVILGLSALPIILGPLLQRGVVYVVVVGRVTEAGIARRARSPH